VTSQLSCRLPVDFSVYKVQYLAVWCSSLQCGAGRYSLVQVEAVCCSVVQCVSVCDIEACYSCIDTRGVYTVQFGVVCCSVLQCVTLRLSYRAARILIPLQCVAVCCSVLQCGCSVGAVWCSVVQCGAVWCSVMQCVTLKPR